MAVGQGWRCSSRYIKVILSHSSCSQDPHCLLPVPGSITSCYSRGQLVESWYLDTRCLKHWESGRLSMLFHLTPCYNYLSLLAAATAPESVRWGVLSPSQQSHFYLSEALTTVGNDFHLFRKPLFSTATNWNQRYCPLMPACLPIVVEIQYWEQ